MKMLICEVMKVGVKFGAGRESSPAAKRRGLLIGWNILLPAAQRAAEEIQRLFHLPEA